MMKMQLIINIPVTFIFVQSSMVLQSLYWYKVIYAANASISSIIIAFYHCSFIFAFAIICAIARCLLDVIVAAAEATGNGSAVQVTGQQQYHFY